jgi:plastocyanin
MSNWDLMMPGMGLTAIGLAGVTISYAGVAHTFIDGMHALTGLTMMIGLIFLSAGILEGGISTSNRAKATTLVILGLSFSFGLAALNFNSISTIPTFAGVMLIIAVPAIVMAYVAMKMPQYSKPVSIIFMIAVGTAVAAYVGFGLYGPSPYLAPPPAEEPAQVTAPVGPIFAISILKGSATQGNPDYEPDVAQVPTGSVIEWTNNDDVSHTVTSSADAGATFDSGLLNAGDTYQLDTTKLSEGTYEYMCIVHPWMVASFVLGQGGPSAPEFAISILKDSATQGNPDYEPDVAQVPTGNVIVWTNNDAVAHTVTSSADAGATFDSGLLNAGDTYKIDSSILASGKYDYMCILHPWMQASFVVGESGERLAESATAIDPNSVPLSEPVEEVVTTEPVEEVVTTEPVEEVVTTEPVEEMEAVEEDAEIKEEPKETVKVPTGVTGGTKFTVEIAPGSGADIDCADKCFIPSQIRISEGDRITWSNADSLPHTVTASDGSFDSKVVNAGKTFSHTFDTEGIFDYTCVIYPWMRGTVTVE